MFVLIWITTLMMIISKYMDCITTANRVKHPSQEQNPFARMLMSKYGIQPVIWGIFALTVLIVLTAIWLVYNVYSDTESQILFIFLGMTISIFQFAVALSNKTGKLNIFTKVIAAFYYLIKRR
ncbi:MAG: hypothetical protein J5I52_04515 [Saprospiraceae bacterium]|nr:hypothetical protein [Saprospiraceae bacterium]